jgi:hypothetical protein
MLQDLILPGAKRPHVATGSAGGDLNRRVYPLHYLPGLCRNAAISQPSEIEASWSFLCRAHAILPVAARHVIAPGVTNDRRTKFSNQLENVLPKPVTVRRWVTRFENTGVHAPAHMLHERTKEAPVDFGNAKISIDDYLGFIHRETSS